MIQLRKYNNQSFLLRYKENNEFKKMYVTIGADKYKSTKYTWTSRNKKNQINFINRNELFERAVDDTFKKYQPDNISEEEQITAKEIQKKELLFFQLNLNL